MPLHLSSLPVNISCRQSRSLLPISYFHTFPSWQNDSIDYYKTLEVEPDASQAAIKKQFYHLSKLHHPDHNPHDPQASTRFVQISEAYSTLGSPHKRERYDREHRPSYSRHASASPTYSHSSSSTPFGSRPASGLSKRRSQFRGPPPSFYRSGGWGAHGAKRQAQADGAASAASDAAAGSEAFGFSTADGSRPSSASKIGWDNDVPYFDRDGHFRTQEQQEKRRRRRFEEEGGYDYGRGSGMLINFILVGGVLSMALFLPAIFETKGAARRKREDG